MNNLSGKTVLADRAALLNGCSDINTSVATDKLEDEKEVGDLYEFLIPSTVILIGVAMAVKLIVHCVFHCTIIVYSSNKTGSG